MYREFLCSYLEINGALLMFPKHVTLDKVICVGNIEIYWNANKTKLPVEPIKLLTDESAHFINQK
jgi:hypothetical protein